VALLAQNTVDFGLEVPAIAALAVGLASVTCGRRDPTGQELGRGSRWLLIVLAIASVLAPVAAWEMVAHHSYLADGQRMAHVLRRSAGGDPGVEARAILARHPSDYALPLMMAEWQARGRRPEAMRWLNRAVFLSPQSGTIHLEVARILARAGWIRHALLELRIASRVEPFRDREFVQVAAATARGWSFLHLFVGTGRGSADRATVLAETLQKEARDEEAMEVCSAITQRRETAIRHWGLACLAEIAGRRGRGDVARAAAERLFREKAEPRYAVTAVQVLERLGSKERAMVVLSESLRRDPTDARLLAVAARSALGREDGATALRHAILLESAAGTQAETLSEALLLQGLAHLLEGRPSRALNLCRRAQDLAGSEVDALRCQVRAARALGDRALERSALAELAALGVHDDASTPAPH
jgi:hypothetical protein